MPTIRDTSGILPHFFSRKKLLYSSWKRIDPSMATKEDCRELAAMAAQYLAENGWIQNSYGEHDGPRCMMGALYSCADQYDVFAVDDVFCDLTKVTNTPALTRWNDKPERTKEEVIGLLQDYADDKLQDKY
jgi:hypothetical protein